MAVEFAPVRLCTDDIPEEYRDEMIRDFYGRIAMRMQVAPIAEEPMRIDALIMNSAFFCDRSTL